MKDYCATQQRIKGKGPPLSRIVFDALCTLLLRDIAEPV